MLALTVLRVGYCRACGDCCAGDPYTGSPEGWCPELLPEDESGRRLCALHGAPRRPCGDSGGWPSKAAHVVGIDRCTFIFPGA